MLNEKDIVRIAVLVSGNGTNLQALIDAAAKENLGNGKIVKVISSNADAYAVIRAKKAGIDTEIIPKTDFDNQNKYDQALLSALQQCGAELVVLAGFMSILDNDIIDFYKNRIINVHPSLIPSFCGKGYYGLKVHTEALKKGVKVTGATVHYVNEIPDGGEIILQKAVDVLDGDTPQTLQRRVMEQAEWEILPKAVLMLCNQYKK